MNHYQTTLNIQGLITKLYILENRPQPRVQYNADQFLRITVEDEGLESISSTSGGKKSNSHEDRDRVSRKVQKSNRMAVSQQVQKNHVKNEEWAPILKN